MEHGEGDTLLPNWAYSNEDGHTEDGVRYLADDNNPHHDNTSRENYDRLNGEWNNDNWLTQNTNPTYRIWEQPIEHRIHEGIDTTDDGRPTPPEPVTPDPIPPVIPEPPPPVIPVQPVVPPPTGGANGPPDRHPL